MQVDDRPDPPTLKLPQFRSPLSLQSWILVGLAGIVGVTVIPQWLPRSQASTAATATQPQKLSQQDIQAALDTLLTAEARRIKAEAVKQVGDRSNPDCYRQAETCVLDRLQRQTLQTLEASYASNSEVALGAYMRLMAIDKARSLNGVGEAEPLQKFISAQRGQ